MKEYLLLATFFIPSVLVLAAAVVTISHADDPTAREMAALDEGCNEGGLPWK
jgi:hypothetical protein